MKQILLLVGVFLISTTTYAQTACWGKSEAAMYASELAQEAEYLSYRANTYPRGNYFASTASNLAQNTRMYRQSLLRSHYDCYGIQTDLHYVQNSFNQLQNEFNSLRHGSALRQAVAVDMMQLGYAMNDLRLAATNIYTYIRNPYRYRHWRNRRVIVTRRYRPRRVIIDHHRRHRRPTTRPSRPTTRPSRPTTRPSRPTTRPSRPTTRPSRPTTRPSRPTTRPSRPTTRPSRPSRPSRGNSGSGRGGRGGSGRRGN